jgi:hypothetical protein
MATRSKFAPETRHAELGEILRCVLEPETPEAEMHLPDLGHGLVPPPHVVEAVHEARLGWNSALMTTSPSHSISKMATRSKFAPETRHAELGEILRCVLEPETPEAEMHLPDLGHGLVPPPHVVEAVHEARRSLSNRE